MNYPKIIQGGMGVAVSGWPLANAVGRCGQLGVVSSTGLDAVFTRRLQLGDVGDHIREAMENFPLKDVAERIWERYFVPGGKDPDEAFKSKPTPSIKLPRPFTELVVVANYVEVFLAKRGHTGPVGINLLEKIQIPTIPSLLGAMLAGVDFVLMGAGIPRSIPGILDDLACMRATELRIDVQGAEAGESYFTRLDPSTWGFKGIDELKRPQFLPIISSSALAQTLARKANGRVDGFVVEGATAGGHNAPPRGHVQLNDRGEPIYGPRDTPDLEAIANVGLPFWLAGSYGDPEKFQEAISTGATGVQLGTPFAFCKESGLEENLRLRAIQQSLDGQGEIYTDPLASPTGFPFKVLQMAGTLSHDDVYHERGRICDLGYLRHAYRKEDGEVGYRCAAEPEDSYVKSGGDLQDTIGRKCLCNGLMASAGVPQTRKDGAVEPPIMTAGDMYAELARYVKPGDMNYTAEDVIKYVLGIA